MEKRASVLLSRIPGTGTLDAMLPFGRARGIVIFDAIDDCSRFVLAKAYEGNECDNLAITFAKEAIAKAPFPINTFRVDNHFGKKFCDFCKDHRIAVIKNDPYSPEQNGKVERWHKTERKEFLHKSCRFTDTLDEINYNLTLYLYYYNYKRRHGGFSMDRLTPVQKIALVWRYSVLFSDPKKVTGILQQYISCFSIQKNVKFYDAPPRRTLAMKAEK